ncbi:MAG: sigma-70 family RNA polymerase sigma factor [Acidimicrobiia bacterium]|nr:sigma-70 family RNA polymerase sigma factor [Acidimicrobiia bacterium]
MTQRDQSPHPAITAILRIAGVDPARIWTDQVPVEVDAADEPTGAREGSVESDDTTDADGGDEAGDGSDGSPPALMDDAYGPICAGMEGSVGGCVARPGHVTQTVDPDPADVARIVVTTLVEAARTGDAKAQRGLYELHARSAHTVARRVLGNSPDAEDAVQEAFIDAFARLGELRKPESFAAWLYRMVRNRSIDILRARRSVPTDPGDLPESDDTPDGDGSIPADVVVSDRETLAAVAAALESLTETDAKAIRLGTQDLDGRDLAVELDVPDRAHAYVRLNRARQRLRHATGAVMLVRHGLRCPDLRRRLRGATDPSELVRVVNRHVAGCEDCRRRRAALLETPQMVHALEQYGASSPKTTCTLSRRPARVARRATLPIAVLVVILGLSVGIARDDSSGLVPGAGGAAEAATALPAGPVAPDFDGGSVVADLSAADAVPVVSSSGDSPVRGDSAAEEDDATSPAPAPGGKSGSAVATGTPAAGEMPPDPVPPVAAAAPAPTPASGATTRPPDDKSYDPPPPPPPPEIKPPPPPPVEVAPPQKSITKAPPATRPPVVTARPPAGSTISDPKGATGGGMISP